MKVKIGKYTYRKASDLRKVMDKAPQTEKEVKLLVYLIGIYSCRFWGFVRYRTKAGFDTDKIQIGRKLSECTTDDASAGDCNKPHVSGSAYSSESELSMWECPSCHFQVALKYKPTKCNVCGYESD